MTLNESIAKDGLESVRIEDCYKEVSPLIHKLSYRLNRMFNMDTDDSKSELTIAFLTAYNSWDDSKSKECKFTSYIITSLNFTYKQLLSKNVTYDKFTYGRKTDVVMDSWCDLAQSYVAGGYDDALDEADIFDIVFSENKDVVSSEFKVKEMFKNLIKIATPQQKDVVLALYEAYKLGEDPIKYATEKLNKSVYSAVDCVGRKYLEKNEIPVLN